MSLVVYDKAAWQIDNGILEKDVLNHFKFIFEWLDEFKLLSEEGKEILELGIDKSVSLNERTINESGKKFLDKYYDEYIKSIDYGKNENQQLLEELYFKL